MEHKTQWSFYWKTSESLGKAWYERRMTEYETVPLSWWLDLKCLIESIFQNNNNLILKVFYTIRIIYTSNL